ncbi:MAG: glycoside hydrolase family 3 C-terminal domain-containing protein, partial [Bifidobacteriaceae bacterium]|jgi:beta-glucosidase|nr:glycoside hydrolase family 3 C-terminal domain-containing protein [Bifidobacteriaceae bacterium]
MSSYNLLNGAYTHEHRELLQGILREEWGFDGAVVTDWGGCNDPVAAITAGGTLQMPSPGFDSARQILEHGGLDQAAWDARVAEVVSLAGRIKPVSVTEAVYAEHQELAREAAAASLVLLRNRGSLLPLAAGTRVAVVGEFAFEQRYQGAGSSLVNPTALEHPIDSLRDSSLDVVAAVRGFERGRPADPVLIAEAVDAAGQAPVVLAYLGLEESDEVEGKDREHLRLPPAQLRLLAAVAQANPNVVVVLAAGSVVEFPWLGQARAVLHTSLGGQAGASAAVAALLGEVNPAGRLAETYPLALADTPTAGRFPARGQHALYKEGPFVGYRYYQTAKVPVRFPFGFGLSYTRFEYEDLAATPDQLLVTVRNTGTRAGADVPQVYVAAPREADALDPRPAFQLKGFQKVCLEPGESRRVAVPLDRYAFRAFDAVRERWVVVGGDYEISVGSSAATRPLRAAVPVPGETAPRPLPGSGGMHRSTRSGSPNGGPPRPEATGAGPASPPPEASHLAKVVSGNSPMGPARGAAKRSPAETPEASAAGRPLDATAGPESAPLPHYAAADPRGVTDAEFAALLGRPLPPEPTPGAPLERTSPLSDLEHAPGWIGRAIHRHYFRRRLDRAARDGQPDLNLLFQHGMLFRTIANMSGGLADMRLVDGVLALVNGHPWIGAGRVMAAFATGRARERALKKRFERAAEAAPARPSAAAHPATGGPAPQDGRARSAVGAGLPRAARPAVDPATARTPSRTAQPERE